MFKGAPEVVWSTRTYSSYRPTLYLFYFVMLEYIYIFFCNKENNNLLYNSLKCNYIYKYIYYNDNTLHCLYLISQSPLTPSASS